VPREQGVFAEDPDDPRIAATEAVMATAIDALAKQGAVIVEGADVDIGPAGADELFALECEFKTDIASYLVTYTGPGYPKSLADLIAFNEANTDLEGPSDELPWNNQIFEEAPRRPAAAAIPPATLLGPRLRRPRNRRSTTSWPSSTSTPSSPRRTVRPGPRTR
jgi:hypothetical protein